DVYARPDVARGALTETRDPEGRASQIPKSNHFCPWLALLRTPRRGAAGVALHAGAVAHQREVAALGTGFAFVAPGLGFGTFFGGGGLRLRTGILRLDAVLKLLGRRQLRLRLRLECRRAGNFGAPTADRG